MADIENITKPLTEAQKNLTNWMFQKLNDMDVAQEEEAHQLFIEIGQIRRRIEKLDSSFPIM